MEVDNNRWIAGGGTTAMSIIGTAAGGAALLGEMLGGGLFGNGNNQQCASANNQISTLKSQVARLQSEKYTDTSILKERDRHLEWVKGLATVDAQLQAVNDKLEKSVIKNASDIACLKQNIALQNTIDNQAAKIDMLTLKNELNSKIDYVANVANQGIATNSSAIACLSNTVANITKTVIPSSSVCNLSASNSCCCNGTVQQ